MVKPAIADMQSIQLLPTQHVSRQSIRTFASARQARPQRAPSAAATVEVPPLKRTSEPRDLDQDRREGAYEATYLQMQVGQGFGALSTVVNSEHILERRALHFLQFSRSFIILTESLFLTWVTAGQQIRLGAGQHGAGASTAEPHQHR